MPQNTSIRGATLAAIALIAFAVLWRMLQIESNFSPVAAIALFAGAAFSDRRMAYGLPLAAMALSDLYLGLHALLPLVYGCMLLTTWLGTRIGHQPRWYSVLGYGLLSSLIFFVLTNFAVWLGGTLYPLTIDGLIACFVMALPFFKATALSTAVFSAVMFTVWRLIAQKPRPSVA